MSDLLPISPIVRWMVLLLMLAGIYFFHGFLIPVLAALVIGVASWPLYRKLVLLCGGRTTLSASLALCIVLLVLVIPMALLLSYTVEEARTSVAWLQEASQRGIPVPVWVGKLPLVGERLAQEWERNLAEPYALAEIVQLVSGQNIGSISRWVLAAGSSALNVLRLFIGPVLMALLVAVWREWVHAIDDATEVEKTSVPMEDPVDPISRVA